MSAVCAAAVPARLLARIEGDVVSARSTARARRHPNSPNIDQARASGAEEKSHKLAFETSLRIIYRGNVTPHQATLRIQSIIASYKQFNTTYLNGFEQAQDQPRPSFADAVPAPRSFAAKSLSC